MFVLFEILEIFLLIADKICVLKIQIHHYYRHHHKLQKKHVPSDFYLKYHLIKEDPGIRYTFAYHYKKYLLHSNCKINFDDIVKFLNKIQSLKCISDIILFLR